MTQNHVQTRRAVLLHLVDALLDNIGPHVRGVRVGWTDRQIQIDAVVADGFDEYEQEGLELALTQMLAAFSEDFQVDLQTHHVNPPTPMIVPGDGEWVFRRREPELSPTTPPEPDGPYR
jgi:hypothetical protein